MNNMPFLLKKYYQKRKNNNIYYFFFGLIKVLSLILLIAIPFNKYYMQTIIKNKDTKFKILIDDNNKESITSYLENSNYVKKYEEVDDIYVIELKEAKDQDIFLNIVLDNNWHLINDFTNIDENLMFKISNWINKVIIIVLIMVNLAYLLTCNYFYKKEEKYISILYYLGYSKKLIFKLLFNFIKHFVLKNLVLQVLVLLFLLIFNFTRNMIMTNILYYLLVFIILNVSYITADIILCCIKLKKISSV